MNDIIRIGVVSTVSPGDCTVRVRFPSEDIVSGWLKVIKSPSVVTAKAIATTKTEEDTQKNDVNVNVNVDVDIATKVAPWFPAVGDTVLCIYNPGFNEDGFVIGGI